MITENLSTLKIHKLTQAQYDRELAAGRIDVNAMYLTPDEKVDLSIYATTSELEALQRLVGDTKVSTQISNAIASKSDTGHNHSASNITSGTIAAARLPAASGTSAGITIVYPAASCTTFSSDSGTVTPLAVQKGAKMFAITRPSTTTEKAIVRYSNTNGDVQNSKIIIEDVTNTKDTSKKANVIAIPAEGNKKMVYGYCTDQVDGTSFIGGVFDASATEYPYNQGLAIGGTSGNLLWKGTKVATMSDIPSVGNGTVTIKQNGTSKGSFTLNQSGNATIELTDTNTAYSNATTSAAGLMSAADKTALNNLGTLVGDTAVSTQISNAIANKSDAGHNHDTAYAAKSHGNHVPATETANNAKFLRNDNTWQTVTPANIGAAASSHGTHVSYSTTAPVMDGTASVGSASTVARSDHRHPTDTSRAAATELAALKDLVGDEAVATQISNAIENHDHGNRATAVTITLVASSWSNLTQTVSVSGATASNNIIVTPAPTSHAAYCESGVYCSAQASNTLTFACSETPAVALTVNVLILN